MCLIMRKYGIGRRDVYNMLFGGVNAAWEALDESSKYGNMGNTILLYYGNAIHFCCYMVLHHTSLLLRWVLHITPYISSIATHQPLPT